MSHCRWGKWEVSGPSAQHFPAFTLPMCVCVCVPACKCIANEDK